MLTITRCRYKHTVRQRLEAWWGKAKREGG